MRAQACYHVITRAALVLAVCSSSRAFAQPTGGERARQLRRRIDGLLEKKLAHGWYPRAVDREFGGFHQNFARDWSPTPDSGRRDVEYV